MTAPTPGGYVGCVSKDTRDARVWASAWGALYYDVTTRTQVPPVQTTKLPQLLLSFLGKSPYKRNLRLLLCRPQFIGATK
jgi:hypothetical protein